MMRRGTRAIIKSFFNFRKGGGAKAAAATFISCLVFILVLFCALISYVLWFFPYHLWSDEVFNIVIVNAPDSFIEYNESTQAERDSKKKGFGSLTDFSKNAWNIINYQYTYDNYGNSKFIYKENDDPYAFLTYEYWMKQEDAYLTVVFPEDFDEMLDERFLEGNADTVDVLTYFSPDSLEYGNMKDQFIDAYLNDYQNYIRENYGVTSVTRDEFRIADDPIPDPDEPYGLAFVFTNFGKSVIPLILFIVIMYAAMSSGTNVIAGQKENGTFTQILMSPLPRRSIILANTAGVTIKSLIPAAIVVLMTQTAAFYRNPGIFSVILYVVSLAVLISSIVILISVMSDTVISAQTTFLPVFLILTGICVTCIQNYRDASEVFYFFPVYGQFYGIGRALSGEDFLPAILSCVLSSVLVSVMLTAISSALLHKERFTLSVETIKDNEIHSGSALSETPFKVRAKKVLSGIGFFADMVFYPLVVLSFIQSFAILPAMWNFMHSQEYAVFTAEFANAGSFSEMIDITFSVMGIFLSDPLFLGLMLPGYIVTILTYVIRVYGRENIRPFKACFGKVGLPLDKSSGIVRSYLTGLAAGLLMMGGVYMILLLSGQVGFGGLGLDNGITASFILNLLMWLPQGMSEEVMFRGFMIPRIKNRTNTAVAVIVSSVLFSAFHSLNVGFTPLAAVNLILIALLFALIYLKTGNIWFTSAVHTMWNLTQGNIIGLQVSGTEASTSILKTVYHKDALSIMTGGAFGPEGGLAVTIVTVICLIILLLQSSSQRKHRKQMHETESA